jgi:8-oxo-dGTP pyrophosphatase MutT (NUDIX family)
MNNTVHIAVKALIEKDWKYLVLDATYGKEKILYHDLPGWRIQEWEDPIEALKREIQEETGLSTVSIWELLWTWWFQRLDWSIVKCNTYICSSVSANVLIDINPDNIEDIVWFSWMTKDELLASQLFQNDSIYDVFRKLWKQ